MTLSPAILIAQLMANSSNQIDEEYNNSFNIDSLELIIQFMPILDAENTKGMDKKLIRLESYIISKIKRDLTVSENINLLEGLKKYVQSEPATSERLEAMRYLFKLKFLNVTDK